MFDSSKKYCREEILVLVRALGEDEEAIKWLIDNDFPELAAFCDTLVNHNDKALDWLLGNGYFNLSAFISAINDGRCIFLSHKK